MLRINGQPWIDLEPYIDVESLAAQKHKIAAALAASHHMRFPSIVGAQDNLYDQSLVECGDFAKNLAADPNYEHKNLLKLLNSPARIQLFCKYMYDVVALNEAIHLRTARGGNYFKKHLAEHCVDTPAMQYFTFFKHWLDAQRIFSEYGRVVFFINEPGVSSIRHRDYPDGESRHDNFIWMSLDGRKNFWVWDDENKEQHNVTSRAALFDNANWHGSDPVQYTGWSLRVDGVFSEEFKDKTGLKDWCDGK